MTTTIAGATSGTDDTAAGGATAGLRPRSATSSVKGQVNDPDYDYIIVGGGSAGAVVAARLAEDPSCRILLLEAGPADEAPGIRDAAGQLSILFTDVDYAYKTVPQRSADKRELDLNAGRVLGGSSSINGMIYVRGDRSDFDGWAYLGCSGWDYRSVLPYFKKSEDFAGGADEYRAVGGPLHVSVNHDVHPLCEAAVHASVEAGFPLNEDYNGASMEGVNRIQHTIKDGLRWSTAQAFLREVPPNLHVLTDAPVQRLVLQGSRCAGVEYRHGGQLQLATASEEVVLSAGVFASPKLLMLSGIGDPDELRGVGITPLHDLPGVGKNLHDHPLLMLTFESKRPVPPQITSFMHSQLFFKSDPGRVGPDLQPTFMQLPFYQSGMKGPNNAWTIGAGLTRPSSRGSLALRSADPTAAPSIDINYLATEDDVARVQLCAEVTRDIVNRPAYAQWFAGELQPGPDVTSSRDLRAFMRANIGTYYHAVGTCAMGRGEAAVVDPELRVYGIEGLRVADASIMPEVTSGNTNGPSIMIGEKAADMIKAARRGKDGQGMRPAPARMAAV